ncbi:MAG: YbhB/YbcL family Raf kinase inhibitor-like protein [Rhodobacteraceae bacterium]|nr:YbhB/YbcL family Raf kinase inhibitor-like protein [Paracoccaceae bacterium]
MARIFPVAAVLALAAAQASAFELHSPDFNAGGPMGMEQVFAGFGCTGDNISPALEWSGAPEGTKSYVLMVHDADAPTGGAGFWHWIVTDIPASTTGLAKGAGKEGGAGLPEGAHMRPSDYGTAAWGGPCPPEGHGAHHYNFTLYAMPEETLTVPDGASIAVVGFVVNSSALGAAKLTGTYER